MERNELRARYTLAATMASTDAGAERNGRAVFDDAAGADVHAAGIHESRVGELGGIRYDADADVEAELELAALRLLVEHEHGLRRNRAVAEPRIVFAHGRQVHRADDGETDLGTFGGIEEPNLGVHTDVADALPLELPVLVVVGGRDVALVVGRTIAVGEGERNRGTELELEGTGLDPERADQGRHDHVADRELVGTLVERHESAAPRRHETERDLLVTEHLRRVQCDVAARVHRGAKRIEVDIRPILLSESGTRGQR
jgi:hypothetical protein